MDRVKALRLYSLLDCCWLAAADSSADYLSVNFRHQNRERDCFVAYEGTIAAGHARCLTFASVSEQAREPKTFEEK
jgi:hypothetical protein